MTVHVIMPVYNSQKTMGNSIMSVLNQTYKDLILYIVDDCSADDSYNIADRYYHIDNRVRLLTTKNNSGPSGARNRALETISQYAAHNDYIAYCDSDDEWLARHLSDSIIELEKTRSDIVYSDVYLVDEEDGTYLSRVGIPEPSAFDYDKLIKGNFIYISSVVHRDLIRSVFDSDLDSLEDYDMWLRFAERGYKFTFFNKKNVEYLVKKSGVAGRGLSVLKKLRLKHNHLNPLKLNLGCGHDLKPDYINVDNFVEGSDIKCDVAVLDKFKDNTVDEILANHVIEHHHFFKCSEVLKEWYRVLKVGGVLNIETPDLLATCKHFVSSNEDFRIKLYGHFFAFPWEPGNAHYFLFTETQLAWTLDQIGFKNIKRVPPDSSYSRSMEAKYQDLYLRMTCNK